MKGESKLRIASLLSIVSIGQASRPVWLDVQGEVEERVSSLRRIGTRQLHSPAEESCAEDAERYEEILEEYGGECQCKDTNDGVVLVCMDECAYCNEDESVCGIQSAQILYEENSGDAIGLGGVFHYVTGFDETIAVENLDCTGENGTIVSCEECNVYVNEQSCDSCEIIDCGDGSFAEMMDCDNIEYGATFNFCEDVEIDDDSVFQALSDEGFEECLSLDVLGSRSTKKSGKRSKGSKKGGSGEDFPIGVKPSKSAKKAKSRRHRALQNKLFT